jgi:glutathione peroxidase
MTGRQKFLKLVYPLFRRFSNLVNKNAGIRANVANVSPNISFYSLGADQINGIGFNFDELKGKKVLIVNVASDCGYTPQYGELQKLHERYKGKLVILGFPSNDFHGQEPGSEAEIETFCQKEYSVTFPLFQKHSVIGPDQHEVFHWLSDKAQNGWNDQSPPWNFSKYLVDERGRLQFFFQPYVSPLSDEVIKAIRD